MREKVKTLHVQ